MIDASTFYAPELPWSGRAADLRAQRAGVALITELGRNYDAYHNDLADRLASTLAATDGRPEPSAFRTLREYLDAWGRLQAILRAEHLLRVAQAVTAGKRPLTGSDALPLVDGQDHLLSIGDAQEQARSGEIVRP